VFILLWFVALAEFTGNSTQALDSRVYLDNPLGEGDVNNGSRVYTMFDIFHKAISRKASDKSANRFYLQSLAAGFPTTTQIENQALIHFLHDEKAAAVCGRAHDIPGMDNWCPPTLQLYSVTGRGPADQLLQSDCFGSGAVQCFSRFAPRDLH